MHQSLGGSAQTQFIKTLLCTVLLLSSYSPGAAAEGPIEMSPIRVPPSQMYFRLSVNDHDELKAIEVVGVEPGSMAEKMGIRKGDRVTIWDSLPVSGMKRSRILNRNGSIGLRGKVTFEGKRKGRKNWTITFDSELLKPPSKNKK